ncbi:MAG TPA: hypothetical protein VFV47_07275 [Hyphomicrobiaceae bacterium]|nr:hypothetical protein [Hyphomicrobiaceae bacterium]
MAVGGPAQAETPFLSLSGTWSGGGQVKFSSGNAEALRCRAYYTPKDTGQSLGLSIRCASQSNKIELRANLNYQSGRVTGSWEERTFNAAGNVTGQASVGKINLSINGGGFSGSMSVGTTGSQQSVVIQTDGIGMQSVNISLSRG